MPCKYQKNSGRNNFILARPYAARKTIFSFSRRPEKMIFPKKLRWNLTFLLLRGNMTFFFPENMISAPGGKWKMIFLKKIHGNMIFSPKRWSFQKGTWSFLYYPKRLYFFPKTWYFFPGRITRERWPFSRNTRKHDILYLICSMPPCEKNQGQSYYAKMHLKVVDIPDQHPRKDSSNSLYLHADLYRRFYTVQQKKTGNLIYRIEVSSSICSVGDIPQWIIFNTLYHSSLRSCI